MSGDTASVECGRLALRVEGDSWVAYYALEMTSMKGAVELGRIAMAAVVVPARKQAFMDLMREVVADMIEDITGDRPIWPDEPQPAPEHERAGEAKMGMHFEKDVDDETLAKIKDMFGEAEASDRRHFLFNKLNTLDRRAMTELANTAKQPVQVEINNVGDIRTMSDGTQYRVTPQGWRKIEP